MVTFRCVPQYFVISSQPDNQKFIYELMTTIYDLKKNIQPTFNEISSMKRIILVLKTVNSKITDSFLNRAAVSF